MKESKEDAALMSSADRLRSEFEGGGRSGEQEIAEMEDLVRTLKQARLSRENSKVDDEDEEAENDDVQVGGGQGLLMPRGSLAPDEAPPASPPPPGVVIEIDMSPSVSKDKAAMMERKREAMRLRQERKIEERKREREERARKEREEREELVAKMKGQDAGGGGGTTRKKKGWAVGANDKAVVLQTLRSR